MSELKEDYAQLVAEDNVDEQPANPYSDIVAKEAESESRDLWGNIQVAQEEDPDKYAQLWRVGRELGVDGASIKAAQIKAERVADYNKMGLDKIVHQTPRLAAWLDNYENASMAHDDLPTGALQSVYNAWTDGANQVKFSYRASKLLSEGIDPTTDPELMELERKMESGARGIEASRRPLKTVLKGVQVMPGMLAGMGTGAGVGSTAAGTAVGIGQPELVPFAFTGGMALGSAYSTSIQEKGAAYYEFVKEMKDRGGPVDLKAAARGAEVVGAINGLIEVGGFAAMLAFLPGLKNFLPGERVVTQQAIRKLVWNNIKGLGKELVSESIQEGAQRVVKDTTKMVTLGDPVEADPLVDAFVEESVGALESFALTVGLGGGASLYGDIANHNAGARNEARFREYGRLIEQAKLAKRAPEKVAELADIAVDEGHPKTVYVGTEEFGKLFQEKLPPEEAANQLGIGEEYRAAVKEGTDIAIPFSTYASKIANSPYHQTLAGDLKFAPEDMTANQREVFRQNWDELKKQMEVINKGEDKFSESQAYDIRYRQLVDAGMDEKDAEFNAKIHAAFVQTMGERTGRDILRSFPLVVTSGQGAEMQGGLEQAAFLERREWPEQRQLINDTVDQWIRSELDWREAFDEVDRMKSAGEITGAQESAFRREIQARYFPSPAPGDFAPEGQQQVTQEERDAAQQEADKEQEELQRRMDEWRKQQKPIPREGDAALEQRVEPMTQTETQAFKKWFGGSKVVDQNGKPLVVYHGTYKNFDQFRYTQDIGFHFGTAAAADEIMGMQASINEIVGPVPGSNVMPVYLKIENPLRLPDLGTWDPMDVKIALNEAGVVTPDAFGGDTLVDMEQVRDWLEEAGYDGIVYKNESEDEGSDSYIVFESNQIKSAIGNRGTFDPSNPNILFQSLVRPTETPEFKRWFDNGAVANEDGSPRPVYHATKHSFGNPPGIRSFGQEGADQLDALHGDLGLHVTVDPKAAALVVGLEPSATMGPYDEVSARIYPLYINVKKPLRLKDYGFWGQNNLMPQLVELGLVKDLEAALELWRTTREKVGRDFENKGLTHRQEENEVTKRIIRDLGYDSVVYLNRHEIADQRGEAVTPLQSVQRFATDEEFLRDYPDAKDSYIVFETEQMKSSIANRGTFSSEPGAGVLYQPIEFKLRKKKAGDGVFHQIIVDGERVGHIGGFDRGDYFDVTNTELTDEKLRGSGIYQEAIQRLADSFPQGVRSLEYQSSKALRKALGKMRTFEMVGDALWIRPSSVESDVDRKLAQVPLPKEAEGALGRNQKRKPGVGEQKNPRTSIRLDDGTSILVGKITPKDWVDRWEQRLTPEEWASYSSWYRDARQEFIKNFGAEAAPWFMIAWAAANQATSPSGAQLNVLRAIEQLNVPAETEQKRGGLSHDAVTEFWKMVAGMPHDLTGLGSRKLYDFIDSVLGRDTRTWMQKDPRGGEPAVIDIWSMRDTGFVTPVMKKWLLSRAANAKERAKVEALELDTGPTSKGGGDRAPLESQYERGAAFLRQARDMAVKRGLVPHGTPAAEIQAVGWMGMLKLFGQGGETPAYAIASRMHTFPIEAMPAVGAPREAALAPLKGLPEAKQIRVVHQINEVVLEAAARAVGVAHVHDRSTHVGGWINPATGRLEVNAAQAATVSVTQDRAEAFGAALAYLGQQQEFWQVSHVTEASRAKKHIAVEISHQRIHEPGIATRLWNELAVISPELAGGFHVTTVDDRPTLVSLRGEGEGFTPAALKAEAARLQAELPAALEKAAAAAGIDGDFAVSLTPRRVFVHSNDWSKRHGGEDHLARVEKALGKRARQDLVRSAAAVDEQIAAIVRDAVGAADGDRFGQVNLAESRPAKNYSALQDVNAGHDAAFVHEGGGWNIYSLVTNRVVAGPFMRRADAMAWFKSPAIAMRSMDPRDELYRVAFRNDKPKTKWEIIDRATGQAIVTGFDTRREAERFRQAEVGVPSSVRRSAPHINSRRWTLRPDAIPGEPLMELDVDPFSNLGLAAIIELPNGKFQAFAEGGQALGPQRAHANAAALDAERWFAKTPDRDEPRDNEEKALQHDSMADERNGDQLATAKAAPITVFSRIPLDFKEKGFVDWSGRQIRNAADLAYLARVLRDPRYETFRIFWMKGDTLITHEAITSRTPSMVRIMLEGETSPVERMTATMQRLGADGYYLMHNHPSGSVTPSEEDLRVTANHANFMPGMRGHIIIDHGVFTLMLPNRDGTSVSVREAVPIRKPYASKPDPIIGEPFKPDVKPLDPAALGYIGRAIRDGVDGREGYVPIIYGDAQFRIRMVEEVPIGMFMDIEGFRRHAQDMGLKVGSSNVFGYVTNPRAWAAAQRHVENATLIDAVTPASPGSGRMYGRSAGAEVHRLFDGAGLFPPPISEKLFEPSPQYNSEAFKKWFGESKVVDSEGKPLVVYHGTTAAGFTKFKKRYGMYGHFGSLFAAEERLEHLIEDGIDAEDQGQSVMPVYLKIENPVRMRDVHFDELGTFADELVHQGALTASEVLHVTGADMLSSLFLVSKADNSTLMRALVDALKAKGYDGIVYMNNLEGYGEDSWIPFAPNQIKSATGNRGSFSDSTGNILKQASRGSITLMANGRPYHINLGELANKSTFLHETGHMFLDVMSHLATQEGVDPQVSSDYQAAIEWMGYKDNAERIAALIEMHQLRQVIMTVAATQEQKDRLEFLVGREEKWARGFEAFLREGKAPSPALVRAFARFARWLQSIYKRIESLRVNVPEDIKDVMRRMIATDEQISQMEQHDKYIPMFENAAEAGMTDEQFQKYQQIAEEAHWEAYRQVEMQIRSQQERETKAWWREEKQKMTELVADEIDAKPVTRAQQFLRDGTIPPELAESDQLVYPDGSPIKISTQALDEMYGEDANTVKRRLGPNATRKSGGVHPDAIAQAFGFRSGSEMINELITTPPRSRQIVNEVNRRMVEAHGDILNDGTLEGVSRAAIHESSNHLKVLQAELDALNRKAGNRVVKLSKSVLAAYAEEQISNAKVRVIDPNRYLQAERKAATEAIRASQKGKYDVAVEWQKKRMINRFLYSAAVDAKKQSDKAYNFLKKQNTDEQRRKLGLLDTIDPVTGEVTHSYLDRQDRLLEKYELRRISGTESRARESLAAWLKTEIDAGRDPIIAPHLIDEAQRKNWADLTVNELMDLADAVQNIKHLADKKNRILVAGKEEVFDAFVEQGVAQLQEYGSRLSPTQVSEVNERWGERNVFSSLRRLDAELVRLRELANQLDGDDPNGLFHRILIHPLDDAATADHELNLKITKLIDDAIQKLPSKVRVQLGSRETVLIPSINQSILFSDLIAFGLNMGNESNRFKMLAGWNTERQGNIPWTEQTMQEMRAQLKEEHWDFIQSIWDALETLWPEASALEKRQTGLAPKKVEAQGFEFTRPDGSKKSYRGGYYPVIYHPKYSGRNLQGTQGQGAGLYQEGHDRAVTPQGHLKDRVETYARPVSLKLERVLGNIASVIHDTTHREALLEAYRFMTDQRIADAMVQHVGEEYYRAILERLRRVANSRNQPSWLMNAVHRVQGAVGASMMGFKMSVSIQNLSNFVLAKQAVGTVALGRAMVSFAPHRIVDTLRSIKAASGVMRYRMDQRDNELRQVFEESIGLSATRAKKVEQKILRMGYRMMSYTNALSEYPAWLAAYQNAERAGLTEKEAVRAADDMVLTTFGGGSVKDLALIQDTELAKPFTMFYGFFSAVYSMTRRAARRAGRDWKGGHRGRAASEAFQYLLFNVVLMSALSEVFSGRPPDVDEDDENPLGSLAEWIAAKTMSYTFGMMPFARDFWRAYEYDRGVSLTPLSSAVEEFVNVAKSVSDAGNKLLESEEFGDDELLDAGLDIVGASAKAVGMMRGLPVSQTKITGGFLWDFLVNENAPENWSEGMHDLLFIKPKERKAS